MVVNTPKLVATSLAVASRNGLPIRRLVQPGIMNNDVPRSMYQHAHAQAALGMSGVFAHDGGSAKLLGLLKTAPGVLGATAAFTEALTYMNAG